MSTNQLTVEVVYCGKSQQVLKKLLVNHGTTVQDVIKISEIQKHFMEVDFCSPKLVVGIFSKITSLDRYVSNYDRIEIYRPLYQSPMQARIARIPKK
jgi:putative ubiquitin-RnfH superfamily antitoxin RatB of RatAB toxin-antitoxin module